MVAVFAGILNIEFLLLVGGTFAAQSAPGTSSRPILSASEAALYTKEAYLQGWTPASISTSAADYVVGAGGFSTIQAAVNAAINAGGTTRKFIQVSAGTYNEVVYIPSTTVPLTIYGAGGSPTDTVITLSLRAETTSAEYTNIVNADGTHFKSGDPAYSMYSSCAAKTGIIGTGCSSVFWVTTNNVQIVGLTIENSSNNSGDDQALALQAVGDQIQVENARLLGFQDTIYVGPDGAGVARSYFHNCFITGDIDFIFGGGSAVFEKCTIQARADRRSDIAVIFAPDTHPSKKYGFLVIGSIITGQNAWLLSKQVFLARAWDAGVSSASSYVAGTSPNGQLVIRESTIDGVITATTPYTTATSGRPYSGNADANRDLNDNSFNRFWEYANGGAGS